MTDDAPPPSPDAPDTVPPALKELRNAIDDVDHAIIDLLAQRSALVGQVADVKRTVGRGIRDHARERALLADRSERAASSELRPDVIESLFRVILWASRDRQAALGVERPPDGPARTVAVIGAAGGLGQLLVRVFGELDQTVLAVDLETALRPAEAAAQADVVIVSVPIDATEAVIREIGPHMRRGAVLADVTSVKTGPVTAMLEATAPADVSVVGTHPLFGPSVHSLQGQRVVLCPARQAPAAATDWAEWFDAMFRSRGMQVLRTSPEHHDRMMGVVQVLTHHAAEVLGLTLARLDVDVDETLAFTSPVYLMELMMAARHFAQSPRLYGSIQRSNPRTLETTAAFRRAAADLAGVVESRDVAAFDALFAEAAEAFGGFRDRALETSSFLIDRLVEREG